MSDMLTPLETGFVLRVRLTPGAAADRIDGPVADSAGGHALAVRVRAIPEKGRANAALEAVLAKALGAPKSAVAVERGTKSRIKAVRVEAGAEALERARALTGPAPGETKHDKNEGVKQ